MTFIVFLVIALIFCFILGILYKRANINTYPNRISAETSIGFVRGNIKNLDIWELTVDGLDGSRTFRSQSRLNPENNVWITKDGVKCSDEEHKIFTKLINDYRQSLLHQNPWEN